MIRIALVAIFLFLYFIFSLPCWAFLKIYEKFNKEKADYLSLRIVQAGFKLVIKISGTSLTVIGEENIPEGAVLFVANHRSYFDIVLTYARMKNLTGYVCKKELENAPLIGTWMRRLYCVFIDREDIRQSLKTILLAIDHVKAGVSIFIFPEGTRSQKDDHEMLPFHAGSFKIAEKTGCPIIPVCLTGTYEIFEKQFPKIKKRHVIIEYLNPIYPKELDKAAKKTLASDVQNLIQETVRKNMELL